METKIINKIFPITPAHLLLKYDMEGLWSISMPNDAKEISLIILNKFGSNINILDGTAGIGGNVISFAKYFNKVCAIELNTSRFEILKNNIDIYQYKNIKLINDDSINYLNNNYDVYFFDPPWGGPDYKKYNNIRLKLGNNTLTDIISKIKAHTMKSIIFKLPINYDLLEFSNYDYNIIKIKNYIIIIIK